MSKLKGTIQGLLSGMFWGLDTSLNGFVLTLVPFILLDSRLISGALLLAFFHDLISAVLLTISLGVKGKLGGIGSLLQKRSSQFVMLASLFAGPLGMRAYLSAVELLGSSLTATISATYPALAAILGAIFLKDRLNKRGWLGLGLTILAVIILGYTNSTPFNNLFWGVLVVSLCVFGWAAESVITAYGMKDDILPEQALFIRQWTSSIVYLFFMFFEGDIFYSLTQVLTSVSIVLIIILATIGTLSYLFYYSAIDSIGPVKATSLNVTYSLWTVIFSLFLSGGNLEMKLIACGFLIIVGSSLIIKN
ncbi:DMT family transporter [Streptococcus ruminantium]|uniref:EamA/RhaT family transporter n=1 Tax=Streptococcus ruminantium TaxID=1917441 RepID=A0A2Z5U0C0_9STRE|nr:DMT family transporter [Streptococcus ruminantium]BBA92991.1 EamA/RhaT family transporter [Streptococcus ruminantium]